MKTIKVYGIAHTVSQCFGHGDYRDQQMIRTEDKEDYYTSTEFPPVFTHREDAKKYIDGLMFKSRVHVVELRLMVREEEQNPISVCNTLRHDDILLSR